MGVCSAAGGPKFGHCADPLRFAVVANRDLSHCIGTMHCDDAYHHRKRRAKTYCIRANGIRQASGISA
jgi:hypothetical protein